MATPCTNSRISGAILCHVFRGLISVAMEVLNHGNVHGDPTKLIHGREREGRENVDRHERTLMVMMMMFITTYMRIERW